MNRESNQSSTRDGTTKRTIQFDDNPPPKHRQLHHPTLTYSNDTVLCTACKNAFSKEAVKADDFRRRRRNQHHESSEDLANAVEKGCYFCERFARHSADPGISTVLNEDIILHPRPDPVRLFFASSEQHTGRAWREDDLDDLVCFNLLKRSPDDEPPARLSPRMDSQETFGTMMKWLNDCVRNHPECRVFLSHSTWLPSRLIDVGDPGSHLWRIIATEHHQTPANYGGYLTLSHRWGSSPFVQLTSDTLPRFQNYTAIESLPKTFRDAIALAHHFNIRHIWIDSLCILQDSPLDWKKESSRMDDVYSNSTCNIVAAHSEGPNGGLFRARDPSVLESFVVCSERTDIPSGEYTVWDHTSILNDYNRAPLYRRGWVFQERLLPKRTLHFGKDQVFWKCRRRLTCESLPDGIPVAPDIDVVEREKGVIRIRRMRPQEEEDSPEDDKTFATVWEHLVEEYSGCSLTYEKDKLAALDGMAGIFSNASLSRYIFGIWDTHIARQICWSLNPAAEKKPRPAHPAPSWSWASVQGKVSFKAIVNSDESILHLARHFYHSAHSDTPAGRRIPLGGYIGMSGSVYTLKVSDISNDGVSLDLDGKSERLDYNPFVFDFYRDDLLPMELVILPLICTREPPVNARGVEIAGLILHPLGRIIDDCEGMVFRRSYRYERVGFFNFRPCDGKGQQLLYGSHFTEAEKIKRPYNSNHRILLE
ncbi:hypothetical protein CaCOL14_007672 [Colletotrichum acutatum]|uniref:Heterokaryon incompatibility protein-domain-containing protein n=1 Tax=Glomerella acutata TaxID=27357 RepID=A0AAD8XLB5_GLOAC|nr:heterokaryon incompatibility protein-domain-containing protein [Colletotrichum acutatum]KAK1729500.1 heterokaryon incompatibility protein-domain-containing protein [Colletotrichum acutatum]